MPNPPSKDFVTSTLNGALSSTANTATIGTGLGIASTDGLLHLDYDSVTAVGSDNGPETIGYATYNSTTGALTGVTRGLYGTQGSGGAGTGVAHNNGATVSAGISVGYLNNLGDGWNAANETWSYSAVSGILATVTVPDSTKYQKGDRIRLKQGGSYKYFYVVGLPSSTTIKISGGTDYTLTNASITDNYFSRVSNPIGFPGLIALDSSGYQKINMIGQTMRIVGWHFKLGNNTAVTPDDTITWGIPFAATPRITACGGSYKNSSDPTDLGDQSAADTRKMITATSVSTTQATFNMERNTGTWNNADRSLFSYTAEEVVNG